MNGYEENQADIKESHRQRSEAIVNEVIKTRKEESMNSYEEKQAARKERYEQRAETLRGEAEAIYSKAKQMGETIPLGQPVINAQDRRFRNKIDNAYESAFKTFKKAEYYDQKAEAVGSGGISSDDPRAIEKLEAKLAQLRAEQAKMRAINEAIRKGYTMDQKKANLMALGISAEVAHGLLMGDSIGRVGIPAYRLQNNSANIRRILYRIDELKRAAQRETVVEDLKGFQYKEDAEENRVMFIFDSKPAEEVRKLLKSNGFKWSPKRGAWVRMLNDSGILSAQSVKRALAQMRV